MSKLIKKYKNNGKRGKDPYDKYCNVVKKLDLENPFINHVAKKLI